MDTSNTTTNRAGDTKLADVGGYPCVLNANGEFVIDFGPELDVGKAEFASMAAAKEAVDQHKLALARSVKLDLPVIVTYRDGNARFADGTLIARAKIKTISLASSAITLEDWPSRDRYNEGIYVAVDWLEAELAAIIAIEADLKRRQEHVAQFKLKGRYGMGPRMDKRDLARYLEEMSTEHASKLEAAQAAAPDEQIAIG